LEIVRAQQPASATNTRKQSTELPEDPEFLVKKRIKHQFDIIEQDDQKKKLKKKVWYTEWLTRSSDNIFETVYQVTYDMIDDGNSD